MPPPQKKNAARLYLDRYQTCMQLFALYTFLSSFHVSTTVKFMLMINEWNNVWKRQVIAPVDVSPFTSGFDELQMQRQNI